MSEKRNSKSSKILRRITKKWKIYRESIEETHEQNTRRNKENEGKKIIGEKFPELRKDRSHEINGNQKAPNMMT